MSIPKYISAERYSKESGLGVEEVKRLCRIGEIPHKMTEGGYYKIMIYDDAVPIEQFEKEKQKRIEAETKLELLKNILTK